MLNFEIEKKFIWSGEERMTPEWGVSIVVQFFKQQIFKNKWNLFNQAATGNLILPVYISIG
jgi:hypothetical protein